MNDNVCARASKALFRNIIVAASICLAAPAIAQVGGTFKIGVATDM